MRIFQLYTNSFKGLSKETWMLSVVMLINRMGAMVLPFLGVYMTDKLGFSLKNVGLVLGCFGVGSLVGSLLGGYLTDRFGEYKIQTISLFAAAPLFLMIPLFKTVPSLMVMILVLSVVAELFRPANSVAITKYAKQGNLTRAFSLNRIANNIGFAFGPALGGILSAISYEFLFVTNALSIAIAAIVYVKFFQKRNILFAIINHRRDRAAEKPTSNLHSNPYRDSKFLLFTIFCALFAICFYQYINTLPIFYQEVVGLKQQTIGFVLGYNGFLIAIFEMAIVNWSERRFSLAKILLYGCFLGGISFGLLHLNQTLIAVIVAMTIMSMGEIFVVPYMSTITALWSDSKSMGIYMGLNGMAFSASFIITPILGTTIASDFGFKTLWLGTALGLVSVGFVLYFITFKMFRHRKAVE